MNMDRIKAKPYIKCRNKLNGNGVREFIYGVNRLPLSVTSKLKLIGENKIVSMNVVRIPIEPTIEKVANFLTLGRIEEAKQKLHYDNLFHLMIVFRLDNGELYSLEKNEIIQLNQVQFNIYNTRGLEFKYVPIGLKRISLNELLNNTISMFGLDTLSHYNIVSANCQDFVIKLLTANSLVTSELTAFIKQDINSIVSRIPKPLIYLADKFVRFKERLDYLIGEGKGKSKIKIHW